MTTLSLRNGVHCCIADGRTAFLDVNSDRYFALPPRLEQAFANLVQSGDEPLSDDCLKLLAPLIQSGILTPDNSGLCPISPRHLPLAQASVFDTPAEEAGFLHTATAIVVQAWVAYQLKRLPLHRTLARIEARKKRARCRRVEAPAAALSAFIKTRRIIGTQNHCLRWSLALVELLALNQYYPDLVLGVRMGPFSAHAWVQDGDFVLNDEVDQIRPYTPILVI
jgi:hypothetical protein